MKISKTLILVLERPLDQVEGYLWVADLQTGNIRPFPFVTVEAESIVNALSDTYKWVTEQGLDIMDCNFVVWQMNEFVDLCTRQQEPSFLSEGYMDFASYFAGTYGLSYREVCAQLSMLTVFTVGSDLVLKLARIFQLIQRRHESIGHLLNQFDAVQLAHATVQQALTPESEAKRIWDEVIEPSEPDEPDFGRAGPPGF